MYSVARVCFRIMRLHTERKFMARKENPTLTKLPIGAIRPDGWLLKELSLVNGLQKRLATISSLTSNSAWAEGEALPRYVRGLVLLYGALGDKFILDKAQSVISSILTKSKEINDFGGSGFTTAQIEGLKAIYSYYALGSKDLTPFSNTLFRFYLIHIPSSFLLYVRDTIADGTR